MLRGIMKNAIGLLLLFIAIGMILMLIIYNRLAGLIVIALLLFVGFWCFTDSCKRKWERESVRRYVFENKKGKIEIFNLTLSFFLKSNIKVNYTLSTLPDLKQLVQTCILFAPPFTLHLTLFTLAFQIALLLLWEWLTLLPKWTPLPQTSHLAILTPPL